METNGIVKYWRDVHVNIITNNNSIITSLSEAIDLSIYHYAVYKAFGRKYDLAHAQALFAKSLTEQFPQQVTWSAESISDLTGMAQLAHWLAKDGGVPDQTELFFVPFDNQLLVQAQELFLTRRGSHEKMFFNIIRYLQLRSAAGDTAAGLLALLQQAQVAHDNQNWTLLLSASDELTERCAPLGLADGLTGEALQLIALYKSGIQHPILLKAVRARILAILATRQEVDFSEGIYEMFPSAVQPVDCTAVARQELTWRSGDLGQVLLLYEACVLLQDEELAFLAELAGLNTLLRKDEQSTAVTTSGFYAGAAGTAHLYYRLHQVSGNPAYETGYHHWLERAQQLLTQDLDSGLYQRGEMRHSLIATGLVLLSAVAAQPVEWEQRFC